MLCTKYRCPQLIVTKTQREKNKTILGNIQVMILFPSAVSYKHFFFFPLWKSEVYFFGGFMSLLYSPVLPWTKCFHCTFWLYRDIHYQSVCHSLAILVPFSGTLPLPEKTVRAGHFKEAHILSCIFCIF